MFLFCSSWFDIVFFCNDNNSVVHGFLLCCIQSSGTVNKSSLVAYFTLSWGHKIISRRNQSPLSFDKEMLPLALQKVRKTPLPMWKSIAFEECKYKSPQYHFSSEIKHCLSPNSMSQWNTTAMPFKKHCVRNNLFWFSLYNNSLPCHMTSFIYVKFEVICDCFSLFGHLHMFT